MPLILVTRNNSVRSPCYIPQRGSRCFIRASMILRFFFIHLLSCFFFGGLISCGFFIRLLLSVWFLLWRDRGYRRGGSRGTGGGVVSVKKILWFALRGGGGFFECFSVVSCYDSGIDVTGVVRSGGERVSAPDSTTYSFKKVAMVSIARLSCMATNSLRCIVTFRFLSIKNTKKNS